MGGAVRKFIAHPKESGKAALCSVVIVPEVHLSHCRYDAQEDAAGQQYQQHLDRHPQQQRCVCILYTQCCPSVTITNNHML